MSFERVAHAEEFVKIQEEVKGWSRELIDDLSKIKIFFAFGFCYLDAASLKPKEELENVSRNVSRD